MTLPVNTRSLVAELRQTLTAIDIQIDQLKRNNSDWQAIRDMDGGHLATPLLVAKAQCLNAIASLQTAEIVSARRK